MEGAVRGRRAAVSPQLRRKAVAGVGRRRAGLSSRPAARVRSWDREQEQRKGLGFGDEEKGRGIDSDRNLAIRRTRHEA